MPQFLVSEAARVLGVSHDTVRRWIGDDLLPATTDRSNHLVVDGVDLASFARERATSPRDPSPVQRSARNRMVGLVTSVVADQLMAQVELQCGPHRVVSLMTVEAAEDLGLTPGSLAVALVKSTDVVVEVPPTA